MGSKSESILSFSYENITTEGAHEALAVWTAGCANV